MRGPGGKRGVVAGALVMVGGLWIATEPLGKGPILVSFTRNHGIDLGDLPAIALLLAAAMIVRLRRN
ncbi:MAG TPA: hypothetical protein VFA94_08985 [Acidimicrobiales bacterium]|nr:hypothetical protein [Acidimicrobiales bacterium]